ncbi:MULTISPECIES: hypothetical protein [unclassified Flavobacterium]|uniref:hypothetical protein n=1 Tax=unclassified Flavobacterium TaxID=196869 RepID=UPI0018E819E1|nr:hypothetical protein [Flavobacterium sp. IB48]MBJ2126181.1 hypothetical protein [Flavobacterium sp. IB48]
MKNLKIYLSIAFISLLTSATFLACSNDENEKQTAKTSKEESKTNSLTSKAAQTTCDITSPSISVAGTSEVFAGSQVTYTYTNTTGVPSDIQWSTNDPVNIQLLSNTGSTITVKFGNNFTGGQITAGGTGPGASFCQSTVNVTKLACCTPILSASYICRGSGTGSAGGSLEIALPTANNCKITWEHITKIDLSLSDGTKFTVTNPSSLYNQSQGTLTYPYILTNNKINLPFRNQQCSPDIACSATFYFNNGCPTTTATVVTLGPLETSE